MAEKEELLQVKESDLAETKQQLSQQVNFFAIMHVRYCIVSLLSTAGD